MYSGASILALVWWCTYYIPSGKEASKQRQELASFGLITLNSFQWGFAVMKDND